MTPISCYIRTLNEERRIARTIRAAMSVASEVVVVDSGSSDATVAIAENEGARVIEQPWLGRGRQKRFGEEACQHDWLLDVDADEILSGELIEEIRTLFATGELAADIYTFPLVMVDPTGRVWRKAKSRRCAKLYDRRKIRMPAHGAWDQFVIPDNLKVERLKGALLHHSFGDISRFSRKQSHTMTQRIRHLDRRPFYESVFKVYFMLPFYFFKRYVLRSMWREGAYGFMCAVSGAYNHWLRDAMLYEKYFLHVEVSEPEPVEDIER